MQLMRQIGEATLNEQYLFVWDKNGNAPTFFEYQKKILHLNDMAKAQSFMEDATDFLAEAIRDILVKAWRDGSTLAISCKDADIDFTKLATNKHCPLETVLDYKKGRQHAEYFKMVKKSEQHGLDGIVNGMFFMHKEYTLCIVSSAANEE